MKIAMEVLYKNDGLFHNILQVLENTTLLFLAKATVYDLQTLKVKRNSTKQQ